MKHKDIALDPGSGFSRIGTLFLKRVPINRDLILEKGPDKSGPDRDLILEKGPDDRDVPISNHEHAAPQNVPTFAKMTLRLP